MRRLSEEQRAQLLMAAALAEAWRAASAEFWERRARELEAARPRSGDYNGGATAEDLVARYERLTAMAQACRARASGADGWVDQALTDTAESIAQGAA